ncbi:MAG: hypothetical protein ACLFUP_02180 [Desulfobacteraceae bacterium]
MVRQGDKTRRREKPKKKGWWARFVERMAKANEESLKNRCTG